MAAKKTAEKRNPLADPAAMLPEGYSQVNNSSSNAWFKFEEGATVEGELVGRFKTSKPGRDGKDRYYYQVKLTKPCTVTKKIEGDTEEEQAEVGDIVNVGEKSSLMELASYCGPGKRFNIIVIVQSKVDIDGGQTYWRTVVGAKPIA
jgi:ribosomal protein S17